MGKILAFGSLVFVVKNGKFKGEVFIYVSVQIERAW